MLHDFVAAILAWSLAYLLRFNFEISPDYVDEMLRTLIWVAPLQSIIFWRFGLYRECEHACKEGCDKLSEAE